MKTENSIVAPLTRDNIELWLASTEEGKRLQKEEAEYFIQIALLHQLNPFKRELYARIEERQGKRRLNLVTGFEVYLNRAAQSGLLDGFTSHIEGEAENLKAVVEIYRKDWNHPFIHEAYFIEVAQRDDSGNLYSFWQRASRYMLRKVALSQGFRLAFPEILAGLPYESAELPYENQPAEHKHYEPQTVPASEPIVTSTTVQNPEATAKPAVDKIEAIKQLVLDNRDKLEETHIAWVIDQLRQPKSQRQLEGLFKHVQNAIAENKPAQASMQAPQNVRRFPRQQGNRHVFPAKTTPQSPTPQSPTPQAAGAEDLIF